MNYVTCLVIQKLLYQQTSDINHLLSFVEDAATRAARRTEHMRSTLQLTEDQVAQVQAINLKHAEAVEAARAADKAQRDQERQELKTSYDADLKAVLTPEQYDRLLEQRRKQTERREERPAPQRPAHQE